MFPDQGPAPYLITETQNTRRYVRPRTMSEMTMIEVELIRESSSESEVELKPNRRKTRGIPLFQRL